MGYTCSETICFCGLIARQLHAKIIVNVGRLRGNSNVYDGRVHSSVSGQMSRYRKGARASGIRMFRSPPPEKAATFAVDSQAFETIATHSVCWFPTTAAELGGQLPANPISSLSQPPAPKSKGFHFVPRMRTDLLPSRRNTSSRSLSSSA